MADKHDIGPDVAAVVDAAMKIFAGKNPAVQGAALAELVSLYLVGHSRETRDEAMRIWMSCMVRLVAVNEAELKLVGEATKH